MGLASLSIREISSLNDDYETTETHRLTQVPKKIAIGDVDALIEYMTHEVKSTQKLVEIAAVDRRTPKI